MFLELYINLGGFAQSGAFRCSLLRLLITFHGRQTEWLDDKFPPTQSKGKVIAYATTTPATASFRRHRQLVQL